MMQNAQRKGGTNGKHDQTAYAALVEKKGTVKFSFAAQGKIVVDSSNEWFKEAMKQPGAYTGGWKLTGKCNDFKNGWYRIEFDAKLM